MLSKSRVSFSASAFSTAPTARDMTLLQELQARLFQRQCVSDPVRTREVAIAETSQPRVLSRASALADAENGQSIVPKEHWSYQDRLLRFPIA